MLGLITSITLRWSRGWVMTSRKRVWFFVDGDDEPHCGWQAVRDIEDPTFDAVSDRMTPRPDPPLNLWRGLHQLTDKQRFVIDLRYGLGGHGEHTEQEVAVMMGISQQGVSRLEQRALEALQRVVESDPIG